MSVSEAETGSMGTARNMSKRIRDAWEGRREKKLTDSRVERQGRSIKARKFWCWCLVWVCVCVSIGMDEQGRASESEKGR